MQLLSSEYDNVHISNLWCIVTREFKCRDTSLCDVRRMRADMPDTRRHQTEQAT
jgi:hypothetical protein